MEAARTSRLTLRSPAWGMMHGLTDVVHELERVRAEQEKQTALLERLVAAIEERQAD